MQVLITGYGGFAGGHLGRELLAATDWRLWGTVYPDPARAGWGMDADQQTDPTPAARVDLAPPPGAAGVQLVPVDLRDPAATRAVIEAVAPDIVFHLAGQTFVPAAWDDPWGTFETNVRGQLNLLAAVARCQAARGRAIRVLAVSTNEVYGAVPPERLPIDETLALAPTNPYATSKAAQDLLAGQLAGAWELELVRVRPFNHSGPGQDPRFVLPAFARQVAEIEAGLRPPTLRVGSLDGERDFSDVRDIVRGYRLAAEHGRSGEVYNLGSGQPRPIRAVVDTLLALAGVAIEVVTDPARMRPSEVPRTACDAAKARRELGWEPTIPFEQTVADVLGEWRARVGAGTLVAEPA